MENSENILINFLADLKLYRICEERKLIIDGNLSEDLKIAFNKFVSEHNLIKVNVKETKSTDIIPPVAKVVKKEKRHELLDILTIEGRKAASKRFAQLAKVPFRSAAGYTLSNVSNEASLELVKLLMDIDIDPDRLVEVTKNYYATTTDYVLTLSNFILNGAIMSAYHDSSNGNNNNPYKGLSNLYEDD